MDKMDSHPFQDNQIYTTISANDVTELVKLASDPPKKPLFKTLSRNGETYLHLAIKNNCDLSVIKNLISLVRLGQRNGESKTALDLALDRCHPDSSAIACLHQEHILGCIKDGKFTDLQELVIDGWNHWPVKGMPEFEAFAEAPMYLNRSMTDVIVNATMYIFTKKQLSVNNIEEMDVKLTEQTDLLGLSLLHKAVLFRDATAVAYLLKCKDVAKLIAMQDNMGRSVLHYSSCYHAHSDIKVNITEKVKKLSLDQEMHVVDKTGYTAMDYLQQVSKIDTKKVANLAIALGRAFELEKLSLKMGADGFDSFVDFEDDLLTFLFKNCHGTALLDVTGRSLLHKLVIFCETSDGDTDIRNLLHLDKENILINGQDIWGRTPLHYAYMLNRLRMVMLLTTKSPNLTTDEIDELKKVKDCDGKTATDYQLEEEEMKTLSENLQKSIKLLLQVRPMKVVQHNILKSLQQRVQKRKNVKSPKVSTKVSLDRENDNSDTSEDTDDSFPTDSTDEDSDNDDDFTETEEYNILHKLDTKDEAERLLFSMKDFTGSSICHYAVRCNDKRLLEKMNDDWMWTEVRDNLGRTPLHFISHLRKNSGLVEHVLDEFQLECGGIASSNESSDMEDDDEEKEEMESVKNTEIHGEAGGIRKNKLLIDLMGKTPQDYIRDASQEKVVAEFIEFVQEKLRDVPLSTYVQVPPKKASSSNMERQAGTKPAPGLRSARFSATNGYRQDQKQGQANVTPHDSEYLKKELGVTLTGAMADISLTRPADPIEYLAQYLYKHAENRKTKDQEQKEREEIRLALEAEEKEKAIKEIIRKERLELRQKNMNEEARHCRSDVILEEEELV